MAPMTIRVGRRWRADQLGDGNIRPCGRGKGPTYGQRAGETRAFLGARVGEFREKRGSAAHHAMVGQAGPVQGTAGWVFLVGAQAASSSSVAARPQTAGR